MKAVILGNNGMYTKQINLMPIGDDKFDSYKPRWNADKWEDRDAILCELTQTITGTNYRDFFLFLLNHDYAHEISVKVGEQGWDKEYKDHIIYQDGVNYSKLKKMVKEAIINLKNDNYFDIKFREPGIRKETNRAVIGFSEREGMVIATEIVIPPGFIHLFTLKGAEPCNDRYYHAILGLSCYNRLIAEKRNQGVKIAEEIGELVSSLIAEKRKGIHMPTLAKKLIETPYFGNTTREAKYYVKNIAFKGKFYDPKTGKFASEIDYDRMAALLLHLGVGTNDELAVKLEFLDPRFYYDKRRFESSNVPIDFLRSDLEGKQKFHMKFFNEMAKKGKISSNKTSELSLEPALR